MQQIRRYDLKVGLVVFVAGMVGLAILANGLGWAGLASFWANRAGLGWAGRAVG